MKPKRAFRIELPFRPQQATRVEFEGASPVLPAGCANCGEIAGQCSKEQERGRTLLVPYCTRCFLTLERERTRNFFAALAGVILAATLLLTVPRLWGNAGVVAYASVAVLGAALPVFVALLVRAVPGEGQTSGGRAVWWLGPQALACTASGWAAELVQKNDGATSRSERLRAPFVWPLLTGPVLALAIAPLSFALQHPKVVILNLGLQPFTVVVDGRAVGEVPITSLESPTSGVHVRLAAGARRVELVSRAGQTLASETLLVHAGHAHLYAPLSDEHCFWLERDAYGRAERPEQRYGKLPEGTRFWTLPRDVDTWFHQNPDPSTDDRSSGGTLLAVRHARCSEAPGEVQGQ